LVLEDVASGLNENRKSLNKLFNMVEKHEIGVVVVGFKEIENAKVIFLKFIGETRLLAELN